jgi:hypothetical protein
MEIQFKIDNRQQGSFFIEESGNQIAELDFAINGDVINAYHTGVRKEYEGQGIAGKLFDKLVSYARENSYKIIPTCSYILAKFRRHPELFEDLWVHSQDEPAGDACGVKPR